MESLLLLGEDSRFIIESDDEEDDTGAGDDGSSSDLPSSYTDQWPQSYRYIFLYLCSTSTRTIITISFVSHTRTLCHEKDTKYTHTTRTPH